MKIGIADPLGEVGGDHKDVASTYNGMAIVYDEQGKYDEALAMYEKALSIRLKKLGDDHPLVAIRTITWL